MAWRNDGNAFVSAHSTGDDARTWQRLRQFSVSGSTVSQVGSTADLTESYIPYLSWDPEGGRIRALAQIWDVDGSDTGNCDKLVLRLATWRRY